MKILETSLSIARFVEAWRGSLSQVLAEAGLRSLVIQPLDAKSCAERIAKMKDKHYSVVLNGGGSLRGTLRLFMSEPEALQLSLVPVPESAMRATEFNETQRGAAAELLSQAAKNVGVFLGPNVAELEIAPAPVDDANPEAVCGGLRLAAENFTPITIVFGPSIDFTQSLQILEEGSVGAGSGHELPRASTALANQSREPGSNLDLLFDVQLEATIRFGGRQLLLRDILSISAGSVIGLDRQVDEPAELLVAGRLVARGEVVVVDGNFGLRITEVTSAHQRSELLHA